MPNTAEPSRALQDKIIVITGGSSGNGRAIALECASRGAKVVLAARTLEKLERVRGEVEELGSEALVVLTDVTKREQVEHLATQTMNHFHRIDVWINNAGGAFFSPLPDSPMDLMRWLIDLNMWSVIHGVQAVVPIMRQQGYGHIINMVSMAGRVGFPRFGFYGATKGFVDIYTQALRQELMHIEKPRIKVTGIFPVAVRTPFFDIAPNTVERSQGAYLVAPVLEPHVVGIATADAIEKYQPVVYPWKPSKNLALFYDLFPRASDWLMARMRTDRPVGPLTYKRKGSLQDRKPIGPFVRNGKLEYQ
jgi:short-subunit dehydrogenase